MKTRNLIKLILTGALICIFAFFALGSGESSEKDQGAGKAKKESTEETTKLGDYEVEIKSCRLAKDYDGKDVVIVKYGFTNNSDDSANFMFAINDEVYQDGIGLNSSYFLDDSANYDSDNSTKDIKPGASLDVEVAYELNDTVTDIEVEVSELITFNDNVIKKTFSIK